MSENYDDGEENNETPMFETDEERRMFLQNVLDDVLSEMHTGDVVVCAKFAGMLEGLLVVGTSFGLLTEEEVSTYIERSEAINDLKANNVISWKPFVFLPPNREGKKAATDIFNQMAELSRELKEEREQDKKNKKDE